MQGLHKIPVDMPPPNHAPTFAYATRAVYRSSRLQTSEMLRAGSSAELEAWKKALDGEAVVVAAANTLVRTFMSMVSRTRRVEWAFGM